MEETLICQSCGMPLLEQTDMGTEKDGSLSQEYCAYCYQNGAFTHEMSMEQMIEINLQYLDQWTETSGEKLTQEEARQQLQKYLPTLKRWQK